jgi:hypothetical protein
MLRGVPRAYLWSPDDLLPATGLPAVACWGAAFTWAVGLCCEPVLVWLADFVVLPGFIFRYSN